MITNDDYRWFGQKARRVEGSLAELAPTLSEFKLVPIDSLLHVVDMKQMSGRADRLWNPRRSLVLSIPRKERAPIAVAMVSNRYILIQHGELIHGLMKALVERGIPSEELPASLITSEYGERMHLEVILGHPMNCLKPGLGRRVLGPNPELSDLNRLLTSSKQPPLSLSLQIYNSVDKSLSLGMNLGWYITVSQYSIFLGVERESVRKVHTWDEGAIHIPLLLDKVLAAIPGQSRLLSDYLEQRVTPEQVETWADIEISSKWGMPAAARVCQIARDGKDGLVEVPVKPVPAHKWKVLPKVPVPGITSPVQYAYDLLTILGWVASSEPVIERRMKMHDQVKGLVDQLVVQAGKGGIVKAYDR
jgi:hypothetical protein